MQTATDQAGDANSSSSNQRTYKDNEAGQDGMIELTVSSG